MSEDFRNQQRRLASAVVATRAASAARAAATSAATATARAQQAAAETALANGRRWAATELGALEATVVEGRERVPREVATTGAAAVPTTAVAADLWGDSRAGLQAANQQAHAARQGVQEGVQALRVWRARRSSIVGGVGLAVLVLAAVGAWLLFRRVSQQRAAAATATQVVVIAQQNATATAEAATAVVVAATPDAPPIGLPTAVTPAIKTAEAADATAATLTRPPTRTPAPSRTPSPTSTIAATAVSETLIVGRTALGTPIEAVRFGRGARAILFIGGMHAGFAPGTVALARQAVDHFTAHPEQIPSGASLYVIISASPDTAPAPGEQAGRLNSNGVDANRNWDCDWTRDARWRNEVISGSGGVAPFSEPEVAALADFIVGHDAAAVVFFEARAENGLVSAGNCGARPVVSQPLANIYGAAADYRVADFENITDQVLNGDGTNWLDSEDIPAIAVLLPRYDTTDWAANLRGMQAVLKAYGN